MTAGSFGYHGGGGSSGIPPSGAGAVPWAGYGFISGRWYPNFGNTATPAAQVKGRLEFLQFTVTIGRTFTEIGVRVATARATSVVRLGIYSDTGSCAPGHLLHDLGTAATTVDGPATIAITVTLPPGRYWPCGVQQGTAALGLSIVRWPATPELFATFGNATLVNTTSAGIGGGYRSTAATFTGALPATAPTLTILTAPNMAIQLKAA